MKKSIYLLAALSLLGTNVFATEDAQVIKKESIKEEYVDENLQLETTSFVEEDKWTFIGRTYLESEDFEEGDNDDGTFWGTGITASKGKLSLDLNVERRFGGDLSGTNADAEWEADRIDYKIRYQLFTNQAFHIKYRNEDRVVFADRNAPSWMKSSKRDRFELGTDFNHFNGLFAGWFVIGHDKDKEENGASSDGNYWEGDFGPSFKLTDKLSFNPTLYTTGEFYDGYEMVETQLRIMMPYQVNDKLTIMPRIRLTLDKDHDNIVNGNTVDNYNQGLGDRIRYELLANVVITEDLSSFMGIAYEKCERDLATGGTADVDLIWSYVGLTYKFN